MTEKALFFYAQHVCFIWKSHSYQFSLFEPFVRIPLRGVRNVEIIRSATDKSDEIYHQLE